MSERKAVIKNADMSEEMQQDAIDCATQARNRPCRRAGRPVWGGIRAMRPPPPPGSGRERRPTGWSLTGSGAAAAGRPDLRPPRVALAILGGSMRPPPRIPARGAPARPGPCDDDSARCRPNRPRARRAP